MNRGVLTLGTRSRRRYRTYSGSTIPWIRDQSRCCPIEREQDDATCSDDWDGKRLSTQRHHPMSGISCDWTCRCRCGHGSARLLHRAENELRGKYCTSEFSVFSVWSSCCVPDRLVSKPGPEGTVPRSKVEDCSHTVQPQSSDCLAYLGVLSKYLPMDYGLSGKNSRVDRSNPTTQMSTPKCPNKCPAMR